MSGLQNSIIKKRVEHIKYTINNLYATPGNILMKTTGNTWYNTAFTQYDIMI